MEEFIKKLEELQQQVKDLMDEKQTREAIAKAEEEESKRMFDEYMRERKEYERQQEEAAKYIQSQMM